MGEQCIFCLNNLNKYKRTIINNKTSVDLFFCSNSCMHKYIYKIFIRPSRRKKSESEEIKPLDQVQSLKNDFLLL